MGVCSSLVPAPGLANSLQETPTPLLISQEAVPDIYQQAKEELPEDWYVLYRIIERIARANNLDEQNWRVVIVPEYNINAFATDVNLIAMFDGMLDQLAGDASAIACVIAHEMGHHVNRHIPMGEAEKAALIAKIQEEAEAAVLAEAEDAKSDATVTSVGSSLVRNILGGTLGNIGGGILAGQSQQRIADAEERIQEIVAAKEAELQARLAEESRKREFEADEIGYLYATRAGFEPAGCLRVMQVLSGLPTAEFDSTHPAIPKRTERLSELMNQYPAEQLKQEGNAIINSSQPLTYNLSKDGGSLRINSRRGGSSSDDLENLFDQ